MMSKKAWLLFFVLLLTVSTALFGCSSDDGATEDDGGGNDDTTEEEATPEESDADVQDTLVFGRGGDSVGLDPITVTDGESFKVTKNIFETLVKFGRDNTEINPGLASEYSVSDDG